MWIFDSGIAQHCDIMSFLCQCVHYGIKCVEVAGPGMNEKTQDFVAIYTDSYRL